MKRRRLRTGGDDFECQSPKPNRSMMTDAKKYASREPTQAQGHVGKLSSTQYWRTTSIWSAGRFLFNATPPPRFPWRYIWRIRRMHSSVELREVSHEHVQRMDKKAAMISIQQTMLSCKQAASGSGYPPWRGELLQIARCWDGNDDPSAWLCGLHQQPSTKRQTQASAAA